MGTIAQNIEKIRKLKGLTQSDMAKRLDLGVSGYGKIESGKIRLSTDRLEQIAKIFDMRVEQITSLNEEAILLKFDGESTSSNKELITNIDSKLKWDVKGLLQGVFQPYFELYDIILDPLYGKQKNISKKKAVEELKKNYVVKRQISKFGFDDDFLNFIVDNYLKRKSQE